MSALTYSSPNAPTGYTSSGYTSSGNPSSPPSTSPWQSDVCVVCRSPTPKRLSSKMGNVCSMHCLARAETEFINMHRFSSAKFCCKTCNKSFAYSTHAKPMVVNEDGNFCSKACLIEHGFPARVAAQQQRDAQYPTPTPTPSQQTHTPMYQTGNSAFVVVSPRIVTKVVAPRPAVHIPVGIVLPTPTSNPSPFVCFSSNMGQFQPVHGFYSRY